MTHWKNYEPIEQTLQFDARGAGPFLDRVQVTANVHESTAYPEQRIQLHTGLLGSAGITLEQSAALRALLERAESDVRAALEQSAGVRPGQERGDG
jgi:hypothetical protein